MLKNFSFYRPILLPLIFFDLLDYPLTLKEIKNFLFQPEREFTEVELADILENSFQDFLTQKQGYYFFRGREEIVAKRQTRQKIAKRKFQRARKYLKLFSFFPFTRLLAVVNFLPPQNAKEESDIDLLVGVEAGHIWLARLFLAGTAKIFRWRPTPQQKKDKLCLSFFLTTDNFNLRPVALGNDDYYFIYWLASVAIVWSQSKEGEIFWQENKWLLSFLPFLPLPNRELGQTKKYFFKKKLEKFFSCCRAENFACHFQKKIMPANLKNLAGKGKGVIIKDNILKFHIYDRRKEFAEKVEQRLAFFQKKYWAKDF